MQTETLLQEAQAKENLSDFGADDFRPGLEKLVATYADNGFSERGLRSKRRRLVDLLAARLRIEQAFKDHPQIRQEQIAQPLYLTGLPRTGTSALLNLLACDSANRPLKLWEGMNPDPCKDFSHSGTDPRYVQMKTWEEDQRKSNPDFAKIHATGADTPEECIHLLNHTFADAQFGIELLMQPYGDWFQAQDLLPSYRYYADLLRMLQWQRPGQGENWRWLLKSPAHLWALDSIASIAPDACIIITHRNPLDAVASYCSMMSAMLSERTFDKKQFGGVVLEYLARSMERALQARSTLDPQRVLDVSYANFIADGVATVTRIYEYFGLPLTDTAQNAFQTYADAHPINRHGKHEYHLDDYGLSEAQIMQRFAFYTDRYAEFLQA